MRGHRLKTVKGTTTRPTSDRVKESLFNIISGYILNADVLDLYAGTGNLGIEALSRGAASAVFVDKRTGCVSVIRENLKSTGFFDRAHIMAENVEISIKKLSNRGEKFDIIFMDPPYNKNYICQTLDILQNNDIIKMNGIIVAERDLKDNIPNEMGCIKLYRNQRYGDTVLSFFKKEGIDT